MSGFAKQLDPFGPCKKLGGAWHIPRFFWRFSRAFVSYLSYFIPAIAPATDLQHPVLGPLLRWFIAVLLIASAAFLNLRGARDVGIRLPEFRDELCREVPGGSGKTFHVRVLAGSAATRHA